MSIFGKLTEGLERLRTAPGEELGRWARFARFQIQLWQFCLRRLRAHNAGAMSAALSFRTIFALVPVLVLGMLMLKPHERERMVRQVLEYTWLARISVPASEEAGPEAAPHPTSQPTTHPASQPTSQPERFVLPEQIRRFMDMLEKKLTLGRVGPIGVLLLVWTAVGLLTTVERSLNRIFEAPRSRGLGRRVLLYWSVVSLGPLVLAGAAYVVGLASEAARASWWLNWLVALAGWTGPLILQIVLLAALYKLMPNTTVAYRAAAGGALVAVPLWLIAKWGFGLYVIRLTGTIYGALGLLPVFFLWLNISWQIFLFGAELAHTAANLKRMQAVEQAGRTLLGPMELLAVGAAVAREHESDAGPVTFSRIAEIVLLPEEALRGLLDRLRSAGIVCRVASESDEAYVLVRPAERIPILEVMELAGEGKAARPAPPCDGDIAAALHRVRRHADATLGQITLADALNLPRNKRD